MDLKTTWMGLDLAHPVLPGPSPLSNSLDGIRALEDAGAPAICLFSLFEEQILAEEHLIDHYLTYGANSHAEAISYFPDQENYAVGPDTYLELIRSARSAVNVPVIASLNGVSSGGWIDYAGKIEEAGAQALELNIFYIPTNAAQSGWDVERMYIDVVRDVAESIRIPVSVKMNPYFSSTAHICGKFQEAGARGLTLFNRFYQPDIDLAEREIVPRLRLSTSDELLLPLRWTAILSASLPVDIAITSGVRSGEDVLKSMMVGARVVMVVSELLRNGVGRIDSILRDVRHWMEEHEFSSIAQMQGSMNQSHVAEPAAFARANYAKILQSWKDDPTGALF